MLPRRSDIARIAPLLLGLGLALALALAPLPACRKLGDAPLPPIDQALPRLALQTADGAMFEPAALAGKVVVLNFWSPG